MRSLEHARLVSIIPNRGVVVRKVDVPEALELYEVRAGLARTAGRLAATRATRAQLKFLSELHEKMNEAIEENDAVSFNRTNHSFHDNILSIAANARLQELDLSVRNEMQLYIRQGILGEAQMRISNAEHGQILAALKAGDSDAAGREFEQHILNGRQRMLENLRTGPGQRDRLGSAHPQRASD
jgi:DNA-binding GntR family transcriptional regulator